jgi:hypothetical protein
MGNIRTFAVAGWRVRMLMILRFDIDLLGRFRV